MKEHETPGTHHGSILIFPCTKLAKSSIKAVILIRLSYLDLSSDIVMDRKSAKTLEAAQRLIDLRFFIQSVHCSYFSVLQLMRYFRSHIEKFLVGIAVSALRIGSDSDND